MAVSAPILAEPQAAPATDDIVVLSGTTWSDYQRLLELRGERSVPRLTYLQGRLEIMSPSKDHESIASVLGRLVEAWCTDHGVDVTPYGSWTLEKKEAERGAEPDECYVIGDRPDADRPDIAIEVVWKSGGIDKLEVYRELGVREVWSWRRGGIQVWVLRGERYEAAPASELLPGLDLALLARFVAVRPMTRAVREYRAALAG